MELLGDIVLALAVTAAGVAVAWSLKAAFLTPVRRQADTDVFTVVRASGEAEGLEQALRGLVWLRDSGRADTCLMIADAGLSPSARRRAEELAERNGAVLCAAAELEERTEEYRWREITQR